MQNDASNSIAILQYNLHKSQPRTYSLLNDPSSAKYTLLVLQEQYWSDHTKMSLTHHSWMLIKPRTIQNRIPRSIIYLNNQKLSISTFEIIKLPFTNVTAVAINTINNSKLILIMNIYNNTTHIMRTSLCHYHNTLNKI